MNAIFSNFVVFFCSLCSVAWFFIDYLLLLHYRKLLNNTQYRETVTEDEEKEEEEETLVDGILIFTLLIDAKFKSGFYRRKSIIWNMCDRIGIRSICLYFWWWFWYWWARSWMSGEWWKESLIPITWKTGYVPRTQWKLL